MEDGDKRPKVVKWCYHNCLSCRWLESSDPASPDIISNMKCANPKLAGVNPVVSASTPCDEFDELKLEIEAADEDVELAAPDTLEPLCGREEMAMRVFAVALGMRLASPQVKLDQQT